jgi:hypothetical protein
MVHNLSRRCLMQVYAGIDLHANNNYLGVVDADGKRVFGKKLPNDPGSLGVRPGI